MKKQITILILLFTLLFGVNFTTVHADDEDIPNPTSVFPNKGEFR